MTGHHEQLPAVGEEVEVGPARGGELIGRVEEVAEGAVVLTAPDVRAGVPALARPGDDVTVGWTELEGRWERPFAVAEVRRGDAPTWVLRATGPASRVQRREYLRVPVEVPIRLEHGLGEIPAEVVDLNEGGARCLVPASSSIGAGDAVLVTLTIEGADVRTRGVVLRHDPPAQPGRWARSVVAVRFADVTSADAERIRRFLFAEQRRQRATRPR